MKIIFIFSCSGMFRDVPECSGMFHVPGFIDARRAPSRLPMKKLKIFVKENTESENSEKYTIVV